MKDRLLLIGPSTYLSKDRQRDSDDTEPSDELFKIFNFFMYK